LLLQDVRRNWRHLALASVGVVLGSAAFVFFLAMGQGARAVVLGEVLPLDRLEVARRSVDLDLFAVRLGLGSDTLGDEDVARLAALPGVAGALPRMQLLVPAVASGGASIVGNDLYVEVVADGVDPALVQGDLMDGYRFANPPEEGSAHPCREDGDCGGDRYCRQPGPRAEGVCRDFVPVLVSNHLVELYNGALRRSHGLPRLNPEFLLGTTADVEVGASMFRASSRRRVERERLRLVGFSDRAIAVGLTMPLGWVQRFNERFGTPADARRYHSVVLELEGKERAAEVTAAVERLGLEVSDHGARRAATLLSVLMLLLALVSLSILASAAVAIAHVFLMLTSVRRHEIGVLRAVGARRGDVRALLLGEAAVVGAGAGVLGVVLGWAAARLVDLLARGVVPDFPYRPDTYFVFAPWIVAAAVVLAVVGCVLGAAVPAIRASSRDPSELVAGS
jgi:hypothetical protein